MSLSNTSPQLVQAIEESNVVSRPGWTVSQLRYLFTPMYLTYKGRLKKSVRFHVIRVPLDKARGPAMLCGRPLPETWYSCTVHAATWDIMPICPKCREKAERDFTGFGPYLVEGRDV